MKESALYLRHSRSQSDAVLFTARSAGSYSRY